MKILLVTQYFYPENFKGNDIAFEMQKRGHEVTVLTGIPNYPQGKFYDGYGYFKKRKENIKGVTVIRTFLLPRRNSTTIPLILNYLSWSFFASLYSLYLAIFKKFDAIIVQQLSPVLVAFPAIVIKKIQSKPMYLWVLDLWPESLEASGGIKNKNIIKIFDFLVKYIYTNSDKILISSKGFKNSILEKGNFEDKIIYFPNWVEESIYDISNSTKEKYLPTFPKGFIVLFAGNIGIAQDLENVLKAVQLVIKLKKNIHFVFLGDGRNRKKIQNLVSENGLQENVHFLGKFPLETMGFFLKKADVLLVSLKDEPIFSLSLPAKIPVYMSSGKPIISMINGEAYSLIEEANCGFAVHAGDYKKLAIKILHIMDLPIEERKLIGLNGKKYYQENFLLQNCMNNLEKIIS